ncbi:MAG: hypothetical protein SFV15_21260 [Polyangiaceae bacterium]|nr:hypothetical protein [Polyangiaceae bacterium]
MITPVDPRFLVEARAFALKFSCEACAYFDEGTGGCGNGYPNVEHRNAELESAPHVVFCKEFELG